ncbi:MAG: hypothetical protein KIS80_06820, partial [Anaerolineales bacterium]|nr:hypothetical protein [Anaerolineales bacterium]
VGAATGRAELAAEGVPAEAMQFQPSADLRYAGQSFELNLPLGPGLLAAFHQAHLVAYGYHDPAAAVELVTLRLRAVGLTEKPVLPRFAPSGAPLEASLLGRHPVRFEAGEIETPFYNGETLGVGQRFAGPAVVVRPDTTILVGEGDEAEVDPFLNLVITIGGTI